MYTERDVRNARTDGYWIGAIAGVIVTLFICFMLGAFFVVD